MPKDEEELTPRELRAEQLQQYAEDMPEGFTRDDAMEYLGFSYSQVRIAIRDIRLKLEEDEINLVADKQGRGEQWIYSLQGSRLAFDEYWTNRFKDLESRMVTLLAEGRSIHNKTGNRPKSLAHREANSFVLWVGRLIEDLERMREEVALGG